MRAKIIEMAREAGFNEFTGGLRDDGSRDTYLDCWPEQLERFYELAQAEEREACAKVCEEYGTHNITIDCAAAIRARGQE